jgi:NADPH2:quinone reductase
MKAIRVHEFGGPEVLHLEDVPVPSPAAEEVLVRVHAAGVNPVDTYIRAGTYARLPPLPYTPGADAAGVVETAGSAVTRFSPGDRVYVAGLSGRHTGTYAEFLLCEQGAAHTLPAQVSFAAGAALGVPYLTAARALFDRARIEPGETVLVHGASGGVGLAALQFARAFGARTLGTASTERGRALIAAQGATPFDHGAAGYEQKILAWTEGRGVDVVIEMLANVNLVRDFEFLAVGGRIAVVGNRGSIEFNPRLTMAKDATIAGTMLWNVPPAARERLFHRIDAGLVAGFLSPIVGRQMTLADASEAHRAVLAPGAAGKIVIIP